MQSIHPVTILKGSSDIVEIDLNRTIYMILCYPSFDI